MAPSPAPAPPRRPRAENRMFLRNFLRNPLRNASVIPSSETAARAMLAGIPFDEVRTVVELGPGVGSFTRHLLGYCRPGTRILLIEIEDSYIPLLQEKFGGRVEIEHSSAHRMDEVLAARGLSHADLIVSGLPFLPEAVKQPLFASLLRQTRLGARFRFFTYMPPIMKRVYRGLPIQQLRFVWKNLPPMWIYGIN